MIKTSTEGNFTSQVQMNALKQAIFNTPLTDEFKIQLLREELSSGQYRIQNHNIVDKLMEHIYSLGEVELAEIG